MRVNIDQSDDQIVRLISEKSQYAKQVQTMIVCFNEYGLK